MGGRWPCLDGGRRREFAIDVDGVTQDRGGTRDRRPHGPQRLSRSNATEDLAGGQGADAAELGEGGAGDVDGGLDVGGGHGDTAVQLVYCGDEVQILPHRTKSHLKKASHSEH